MCKYTCNIRVCIQTHYFYIICDKMEEHSFIFQSSQLNVCWVLKHMKAFLYFASVFQSMWVLHLWLVLSWSQDSCSHYGYFIFLQLQVKWDMFFVSSPVMKEGSLSSPCWFFFSEDQKGHKPGIDLFSKHGQMLGGWTFPGNFLFTKQRRATDPVSSGSEGKQTSGFEGRHSWSFCSFYFVSIFPDYTSKFSE